MADLVLLPSTTYMPPSPSPDRRPGRPSNTVMEHDGYETQRHHLAVPCHGRPGAGGDQGGHLGQWLSPRGSDHFPTPRGFHFLSAPILPSSPSTNSADESGSSPSLSSNAWNRASLSTDVTDFDDIYDIYSIYGVYDQDPERMPSRAPSVKRRASLRTAPPSKPATTARAPATHRALPRLQIPAAGPQEHTHNTPRWSARPDFKKLASPVPPTPPAKVALSPSVVSFWHARHVDVPTASSPPSLDGSLSSEHMAALSAPPTPVLEAADEQQPDSHWSGVRLQPGALATLRALSGASDAGDDDTEQVIEMPEQPTPEMQQQTPLLFTPVQRPSADRQQSSDHLTRLDVPSPTGFFSGLSPRTRHTWHLPSLGQDDLPPPTSTTAEQFYRCPWNNEQPATPVPYLTRSLPLPPPPPRPSLFTAFQFSLPAAEQVVEVRGAESDGMPTARPAVLAQTIEAREDVFESPPTARWAPERTDEDAQGMAIALDHDAEKAKQQQKKALSKLDRTELWLRAQKAYLRGVQPEVEAELWEPTAATCSDKTSPVATETPAPAPAPAPIQRKKTVRFSEVPAKTSAAPPPPANLPRPESAYYRAFLDHRIRSRGHDAFVHRLPRFEAVQAQRVSLRASHQQQLLGQYQLSAAPQSAQKRMSANVVRGDDELVADDASKLRREKEAEARAQMAAANWHVAAAKALNGGRLFSAPLAATRLSRPAGTAKAAPKTRTRVLDLGGTAACDWAWHCAAAHPHAKVYTVTTKALRQLSNSNMRGPPNHRAVAVARLTKLPFPDAWFDLVSARELHSILKVQGAGAGRQADGDDSDDDRHPDEWAACLAECLRVLKPGGYLDFAVLDSDVVNAGPLGLARSVEFGFALRTLGYDPNPTRRFLARLHAAGFRDARRAWVCLPMGQQKRRAGPNADDNADTAATGTDDAAASVSGLFGAWAWERWLLRCEMESVACEGRLVPPEMADIREAGLCLDGVHDVIEEGRMCGAGWRLLTGFARKPTV